ncbi:MAG: hypothetical protein ACI835_001077 [Planctomycetota bacterium]|jgi:hypothetical protein
MRSLLLTLSLALFACQSNSGTTFTRQDSDAELTVGEYFSVRLGAPIGVAPEYVMSWGTPEVEGSGVEYLSQSMRKPGKGVDGGTKTTTYRFRTDAVGTGVIEVPCSGTPGYEEKPSFRLSFTVSE